MELPASYNEMMEKKKSEETLSGSSRREKHVLEKFTGWRGTMVLYNTKENDAISIALN